MKRFAVLLLLSISACQSTPQPKAEPPRPISGIEKSFITTSYTLIHQENKIPSSVRALITPQPHPIANPGEDFNETDAIVLEWPMDQLIFGGTARDTVFVLYRTGGFAGLDTTLLIARIENGDVTAYCKLSGGPLERALTVRELQDMVSHTHSLYRRTGHHCN